MMKLRIDVVETDAGIAVKFSSSSEHLQNCPHCIAMMALRVANSFHEAMQDAMRRTVEDEDETEQTVEHHALH